MLTACLSPDEDFLPVRTIILSMAAELFSSGPSSVAILDLNCIDSISPGATAQWLHPHELDQLAGFNHKKRSREWLGGRLCAKQGLALSDQLQEQTTPQPSPKSVAILYQDSGQPFFADMDNNRNLLLPQLSISHSKGLASALCAASPCGIDIQYQSKSLFKVREKFVTAHEEQLLLSTLPMLSPTAQLSLIWAGKEALKKMLSPTGMPGFLDLHLKKAISRDAETALLFFAETRRYNTVFQVIAGMQNDAYGIALCCKQKSKSL